MRRPKWRLPCTLSIDVVPHRSLTPKPPTSSISSEAHSRSVGGAGRAAQIRSLANRRRETGLSAQECRRVVMTPCSKCSRVAVVWPWSHALCASMTLALRHVVAVGGREAERCRRVNKPPSHVLSCREWTWKGLPRCCHSSSGVHTGCPRPKAPVAQYLLPRHPQCHRCRILSPPAVVPPGRSNALLSAPACPAHSPCPLGLPLRCAPSLTGPPPAAAPPAPPASVQRRAL